MNKNIRIVFFLTCLCSFWLISCTPKVPDEAEIVIISYNDLHGDFENLPQLSAFLQETRATYKHVIMLDAGDRFTGNPFNDFAEKKQFPIVNLLNYIGIDMWLIGNHEFDYGVELLNERMKESNDIVIAANLELETSGLTGVKPYHIFNKDGIRIAFFGLTNVEKQTGKPAALTEHVANIQFFDPIETAMTYRFLRKKAHVFIALTHIGLSEDLILADSMPELDLIVGGHSHTLIDTILIRNDVLITQSGYQAKHIVKTKIKLEKGIVSDISTETINLQNWEGPVDSVLIQKIETYKNNPFLMNPFTSLKYEIPNLTQLGHMMTDAALTLANVDLSIMNCGGIRIRNLPSGPLTYGDILRLSPFNNYLVVVDLKPAEIRKVIEMEFSERKDCLMIPAGFEYVAKRMPDGNAKIGRMTYRNGKILDENKTYRVVLNNYIFSKYLQEHIENARFTEVFVVDNIVTYLQNNPNVDYRNVRTRARFN
ncbi:MAG: bifunctional metallophosphatase/5'-nucleotidase [Bacteroidales bacterium]|nr:bifunctional metallophosphatase/5'-nucleotidase [Bacteroidales bacterium]